MNPTAHRPENWAASHWNGEPAWTSCCGPVRAIVSEARSRLIYFGADDGTANLLSAPHPRPAPTEAEPAPNWGGHRFWLGPQLRWVWPPLAEWEFSACAATLAEGPCLRLSQERHNTDYPAIEREYRWEGQRLRCAARWADDGRGYYGMHVVAVQTPLRLTLQALRTPRVPDGFVLVKMDGVETQGLLPHPSVEPQDPGELAVVSGRAKVKLGFEPQPIAVSRDDGWRLVMFPGENRGAAIATCDHGYLSQVWVGDELSSFAEIEQISPVLLGGQAGCESSMYLSAERTTGA